MVLFGRSPSPASQASTPQRVTIQEWESLDKVKGWFKTTIQLCSYAKTLARNTPSSVATQYRRSNANHVTGGTRGVSLHQITCWRDDANFASLAMGTRKTICSTMRPDTLRYSRH